MGEVSGFTTVEEYCAAADEILATMCRHNLLELIAAMALADAPLFQWALAQTSVGCDASV